MSWKNTRDAKRDIRAFSAERGIEAVAGVKELSNSLAQRMTSIIRDGEVKRMWGLVKPQNMPEMAESNILWFSLHEMVRHLSHVKILSEALAKGVEDPDNFAQSLIMTLKQYRNNPDISDLIKSFGLDQLEDYEEDVFLDDDEEEDDEYDDLLYDDEDEDEDDEDDDFDFLDEEDDDL